ncbi:MAG: Rieske 2Fe-2S domain-containing protein [Magnetococcus sp. WYHC-3]
MNNPEVSVVWTSLPNAPRGGERLVEVSRVSVTAAVECSLAADPELAAFRILVVGLVDGTVRAYVNRCRHFGVPFNRTGVAVRREEGELVCGVHGARYRVETGRCLSEDCDALPLLALPVEVRDGWVLVQRPE